MISVTGEQEIAGLTNKTIPRRLGPKRASKIRKLFNLSKEDDVRQYVVRRPLPAKEGRIKSQLEQCWLYLLYRNAAYCARFHHFFIET